jgi:hypothetical protein
MPSSGEGRGRQQQRYREDKKAPSFAAGPGGGQQSMRVDRCSSVYLSSRRSSQNISYSNSGAHLEIRREDSLHAIFRA